MPISYANPTSGPSAGGIGWFNFGALTLNPGDSLTGLTGTLSNGVIVTFDIAMTTVTGQALSFVASTIPTYPGAYFGSIIYTTIAGNVALYNSPGPVPTVSAFTLSNIVLTNPDSTPVNNYSVILADAESTGPSEGLRFITNGGVWQQLAGNTPPILTGLGTQIATITGTTGFPQYAHVLYSQSPTSVVVDVTTGINNREAFAIGFATTRVRLQKNIAGRIDPTDQFVLDINGTPAATATTAGSTQGLQSQIASTFATALTPYTFNESMAPGSASLLSQYTQMVSAANATPAGSIPPTGNLPITFTPILGDDVTYTILNVAPQVFTKTVDKAFADLGDVLTYTIRVDNPNNFALTNVLVTDATPAGTTYLGNIIASTAYTGTDLATGITLTSIPANGFATISWLVQVNSTVGIPNPIPNVANIDVPGGTSGPSNIVTTQVNTAFVSMNKVADKVFARTGDIITYTIMLNNAGNVPANNIVITDVIPAGTSYVAGSLTGATGTPPTLTLTGSIPAGGNATVTFQVLVGDTIPNPNPIVNTATSAFTYTVDPNQPNGVNGDATSNAVSTQINAADVTTVKTVTPSYADFGTILTYTLLLTNNGNVDANNVVITDAVPAGTTFVPGSVVGATGTPPTLTLAAPIVAGGNATVTFQVQVDDAFPVPNPIPNSAAVDFTFTLDPANPNGASGTSTSDTVTTPVNHVSLLMNKTADKIFADINDVITYTITLQNTGNTTANNVVVTDVIPTGTTFIAGSLFGATGTPPTFALLNSIAAGGIATISFQVQVGDSVPVVNPLANTATSAYTYTVDPNVPDGANGTDASNTATTQVNTADVVATKTVDKAFADVGDTLTYTITLQNNGNVVASNVIINDPIPAGTTFIAGSVVGATGTPPTLTLTGPIPAGGSVVVSYQVKVANTVPNTNPVDNTASATFVYTVDPTNPNGATGTTDDTTASTQVNNANLSVIKSADKEISFLGDIITYQLAVKNSGNVTANNVVLTDLLPAGLSLVPGSLVVSVPYTGTLATGLQITSGIAANQTVSITFKAHVDSMPLPNPIENVASASYTYTVDPADPNGVSATANSNPIQTVIFRFNYTQQINDLIESVAFEQAALAAIANAEGAKIQKIVAMGGVSAHDMLCINKSVADMLASITLLESILKQKLGTVDCQINGTTC